MVRQQGTDLDLQSQLDEQTRIADHFRRLLAAVVTRVGPVSVPVAEFDAARPGDLRVLSSFNVFGAEDERIVAVMAEDEGDHTGLVTRDDRVVAVLERTCAVYASHDRARHILTAVGLPCQPEY